MEIKLVNLKVLVNNISSFFHLSAREGINSKPVQKYYQKMEDLLKLIKPILDVIVDSEVASDEKLQQIFAGLSHAVGEMSDIFDNSQPPMSCIYFALQAELLIAKVRTSGLEIFKQLKSLENCIPSESTVASLELCVQKLKHIGSETIMEAIKEQVEASGATSQSIVKIADSLNLKSNQELFIEVVALEKLKENAEQADNNGEVERIDQVIALVTQMRENLILSKQSQSSSHVSIPADFCCLLSLELMTDPVVVASGHTYERAFISRWIEHGLSVCPKSRQALAHTNLIPNILVKSLIASWRESTNVKLPGPLKSSILNQPVPSLVQSESASHVQTHSRVNNSTSPDSTRSVGSPRRSLISFGGIQHEESRSTPLIAQREPDFRCRIEPGPRFQTRWFVPRIISSPAVETRDDLSDQEAQVRSLVEELVHLLRSPDNKIQETAVTALLNLSINGNNKAVIANAEAIESLIHVRDTGSPEAKKNAAVTLFSLSVIEENEVKIGSYGSIQPPVDLLDRLRKIVERHAKKIGAMAGGWPDLCSDLLSILANRLSSVEDLMTVKDVCISWQEAASVDTFISKIPLLLIVGMEDNKACFYSLTKRKIFMIKSLPIAQCNRCTDVGFGWIMTLATSGEVVLFNPFSAETIHDVPNYTTLPGYESEFMDYDPGIHSITKGLVTANPSQNSNFSLLLVIVGKCIGIWRRGDTFWTRINSNSRNVVFRFGNLYSVTWQSTYFCAVEVWSLGGELIDQLRDEYGICPKAETLHEPYLVESTAGELLLLFRCNDRRDVNVYLGAESFRVISVDFVRRTFENKYHLGDDAVFIGDNAAVSVDASEFPHVLKPNCIYFTDDRDRYLESFDCLEAYFQSPRGLDMGIYVLRGEEDPRRGGTIDRFSVISQGKVFTIDYRTVPMGIYILRAEEDPSRGTVISREMVLTIGSRTHAPIWIFPTITLFDPLILQTLFE